MLRIASSSVHSILKTLLNLLVVVATVATIAPLSVDRRAGGSDYSEDKSQRYESATKSLFHFSPPPFEVESATVMPLFLPWNYLFLLRESTQFMQTGCSGFDTLARKEM
jgi:NADH:ubiquinone oxidoreductase subunit 3 (subunit A)